MNTLEPIERAASLAEQVYGLLREYLRSGGLKWGEALREGALAARFGVSRTPVREALGRLAGEGLVEAHGRSFTVPSLTGEDLDDIYELRLLLETEAVRQAAAQGADGGEVQRALDEAQEAIVRGDAEGFISANSRFRAGWLALVRNRRLVRTVELYADHVRALQFLTLGDKRRQQVVLRGMQAIFETLRKRDPEAAAAAMRHYLGISRDAMLQAAGGMTTAASFA